jgi:putative chitinase
MARTPSLNNLIPVLPSSIFAEIVPVAEQFQINTSLRLSHFLAQCHHESMGFRVFVENMNYSEAALLRTFPKYFSVETAKKYARKPAMIGNRVYGGRMGNGPEASGEGYRYRGRGAIQLTGKLNYTAFNNAVPDDVVASPELVATKYPLLSAAWFWNSRKLNLIADRGPTEDVVTAITRIVNGGTHGLADRQKHFKYYWTLLQVPDRTDG